MTTRKPDIPGLTLADWQAYRAGTLSPEATRRVEELLLAHPFEADAAEGWDALGAERAAALTDAINRDIAVLSQNDGHAVVPGLAPRHAGKGRIRRMNPARWAAAAVLMGAMVGGLWFITRVLNGPGNTVALEQNDARQQPMVKPEAATEALPLPTEASDSGTGDGITPANVETESQSASGNGLGIAPTASVPAAPPPPRDDVILDDEAIADTDMDMKVAEDALETRQNAPVLEESFTWSEGVEEEPSITSPNQATTSEPAPQVPTAPALAETKSIELADSEKMVGNVQNSAIQRVQGKVVDASSGEPLIGATITLPGTETGTVADLEGRFALELPPGDYAFQANYIGFEPVTDSITLASGVIQNLDLALEPASLAMDAVVISEESVARTSTRTLSQVESKGGRRRKREERAATKSLESANSASDDEESVAAAPATSSTLGIAALTEEAQVALDENNGFRALGILSAVSLRPAGENTESDKARIQQAQAHLLNGSPELVPDLVMKLAALPESSQYDPARFYLAEARFQMGETEAARILWRALAYENGDWAARARTRLEDTGE